MNHGATLILLLASTGVSVASPGFGPSYLQLDPEPIDGLAFAFDAEPLGWWSTDPCPIVEASSGPSLASSFEAEPL